MAVPSKDTHDTQRFVYRCGLPRVYQPSALGERPKKNLCPDCHFCQQCSDARCHACRGTGPRPPKRSFAEQIALFESLNAGTRVENPSQKPRHRETT